MGDLNLFMKWYNSENREFYKNYEFKNYGLNDDTIVHVVTHSNVMKNYLKGY